MKADMKGQLGSTDDTNGEERRGECWTVVTLQAYAETTSHTLRHSAVPADVRQMRNLTMEELWTAESTWEARGGEAATRQEHTGDTLENGDLTPSTRHATILSSKRVLIKRFIRARRKNTLCEQGRWSNQAN
ncbi:hypothetical protein T09_2046 [Trichinella sp. T9]|nr:hypothetical protein T09_2046 [Trichinella sp. T9]